MKLIPWQDNTFYIVTPLDLTSNDKCSYIKNIKNFLLRYNQIFHFLEAGFYEVEVGKAKILGTVLKLNKMDDFDFGDSNIDLRIILVDEVEAGFVFDELPSFPGIYYLYKDKIYLFLEDLKDNFYSFLEHGSFVFHDQLIDIKQKGEKFVIASS